MSNHPSAEVRPRPMNGAEARARRTRGPFPDHTRLFGALAQKHGKLDLPRTYNAPNDAPFGALPLPIGANDGRPAARRRREGQAAVRPKRAAQPSYLR